MSGLPNNYVGRSILRVEDERLLQGKGCFVDDMHIPDCLHAVIVRSQIAHGRLRHIDSSAALTLDGVVSVITANDIPKPIGVIPIRIAPIEGGDAFRQPVIAHEKVRYVGEPVAVVLASTQAIAEDAAELVHVKIEEIDPVPSVDVAGSDQSAKLFEPADTNVAAKYRASRGDIEAAFSSADCVLRETFAIQRHTAMPMEMRGLLAKWDAPINHLTVWGAAKVPFFNRNVLAGLLGLPKSCIDLIELDVGGGFGVRGEFYPEDFLIPFAARLVGRPVKWQEDRREHMMATNHSRETYCDVEIACRRNGEILGLRGSITADIGAYMGTTGGILASRTAQFLPGPYRVQNVSFEVSAIVTNKTPAGSYRGPGRFESTFVRERLFDMVAKRLNIDPLVFRQINLIRSDELPFDIGQLVPYEGPTSYDHGDYVRLLNDCAQAVGWKDKEAIRGKEIDGRYHGLGFSCFVDSSGAGPKENAKIRVEPDGNATVFIGSCSLGQGIETALAQICADELRIPMERIKILHGSTTFLDEGFGSFHSRTIIMGGNAIADAVRNLVVKIRAIAAEVWAVAPEDISYEDGFVREGARILSLAGIVRAAGGSVEAQGTFGTKNKPFAYGTHAAHVAVDIATGHVEVLDYVAMEDVGRMVNPMIVHGQKIGAIVQGLGGVFLEQLIYDDRAQLMTGSLADYLMPTATDFRNVRAFALDLTRTTRNPLGFKGAGEDAIAPVAGVIGNAIADALRDFDVEPRELPITPPKLWALINSDKSKAQPASL
jgi:carbon-monoxide dehydrogenase large subunit